MNEKRFWSLVDVREPNECWLWKGNKSSSGYGRYNSKYANRIMYELVYGPLPDNYFACHNCPDGDNPLCVNPFHLWAGTAKENIQDAINKGRLNNKEQRIRKSERLKGKCLPEEIKIKIGTAQKGRHHTEETKKKMSISAKNHKSNRLGKSHTEETKNKMSLNHKGMAGKSHTEETRIKMSESRRLYLNRIGG